MLLNGVYGEHARYRFALVNPQRNRLQTWRFGLRITLSHFVMHREERAAPVQDPLRLVPTITAARRPHPKLEHRLPPPARGADKHTLSQFWRHPLTPLPPPQQVVPLKQRYWTTTGRPRQPAESNLATLTQAPQV